MSFVAHNPIDPTHDWPGHPENKGRAASILRALQESPRTKTWARLTPDRPLKREEAALVHTPRLWINLANHADERGVHLDPDTYMVEGSYAAALTTARVGLQAVERAMRSEECGFVAARPPGHHATKDRSMGFCLLNNVAIAAAHALSLGARRVLIFDHDVHHGNGTQDIFYDSDRVLYQSFHLAPHYPGTGAVEEIGEGAGRGFSINATLRAGDGEPDVRGLLRDVFLPIAKEFKPDLVLFSSGFDSLQGDPLGGLELMEPFYGEMAQAFREISPRVVAFLEGGYQLDRIGDAAAQLCIGLERRAQIGQEVTEAAATHALKHALGDAWTSLR